MITAVIKTNNKGKKKPSPSCSYLDKSMNVKKIMINHNNSYDQPVTIMDPLIKGPLPVKPNRLGSHSYFYVKKSTIHNAKIIPTSTAPNLA